MADACGVRMEGGWIMQRIQPSQRVEAQLERGRYSWIWVVPECPYCGQAHDHYAGPLDRDPAKYLGHSVRAPCPKMAWCTSAPAQPAVRQGYVLNAERVCEQVVG